MFCERKQELIKIDGISFQYDKDSPVILRKVDASICDLVGHGQVVAILGPSGIGKTSLFKILSGLRKPTSGAIMLYMDEKHKKIPVRSGLVGVVAQDYPLLWHRSVLGNLMVAARLKNGLTRKQVKEKAMEYLEKFELAHLADCNPRALSGGQRQRVAIIQQILCSDHFILMDEPFSGLDPIAKNKVSEFIKFVADMDELNTMIVVTHDIYEAVRVADTIWLLGLDHDSTGKAIPGAYIKKEYDLIARDLAWHKDVHLTPAFASLVKELHVIFPSLK